MQCVEVGWEVTAGPSVGVGTIEAKRVAIVAVDIDFSYTGSRGIVPVGSCIVADKGNDDAGIASLIFNILHVIRVGEISDSTASPRVLILRLIQDDRSTIGNLALGNCRGSIGNITIQPC